MGADCNGFCAVQAAILVKGLLVCEVVVPAVLY